MHTIRLRRGWELLEDGWSRRRFHKPTGLDAGQRVWLVADRWPDVLTLNGNELGAGLRHDVTDRLAPSNELQLFAADDGIRESVRLEIELADEPRQT